MLYYIAPDVCLSSGSQEKHLEKFPTENVQIPYHLVSSEFSYVSLILDGVKYAI